MLSLGHFSFLSKWQHSGELDLLEHAHLDGFNVLLGSERKGNIVAGGRAGALSPVCRQARTCSLSCTVRVQWGTVGNTSCGSCTSAAMTTLEWNHGGKGELLHVLVSAKDGNDFHRSGMDRILVEGTLDQMSNGGTEEENMRVVVGPSLGG